MKFVTALIVSVVLLVTAAGCSSQPDDYWGRRMMDGRDRQGVSMMDHFGAMNQMMRDDDRGRGQDSRVPWWHRNDDWRDLPRACPMWRR